MVLCDCATSELFEVDDIERDEAWLSDERRAPLGEAIRRGQVVVKMSDVATKEECDYLLARGLAVYDEREKVSGGSSTHLEVWKPCTVRWACSWRWAWRWALLWRSAG